MSKKMPPKGPFDTGPKLYTAKELDALLRKHAMKMKKAATKESGLDEEGSS